MKILNTEKKKQSSRSKTLRLRKIIQCDEFPTKPNSGSSYDDSKERHLARVVGTSNDLTSFAPRVEGRTETRLRVGKRSLRGRNSTTLNLAQNKLWNIKLMTCLDFTIKWVDKNSLEPNGWNGLQMNCR
ncbi:hypothetical protein AVEN_182642-1 [Araneus ventricosus]|uniref:Uncharacterized protein n=1 Tax=Araneus ventricosus TaxID=182803 RepID=A0A4Y2M580_ARAVE|nr:hypothetical protein AVEN_182642-1 [Araneus ventricosus]